MSDEQDKKIQEDLAGVFRRLDEVSLKPDPYLTTRVMARRRERSDRASVPGFWKWLGIGGTALSASLAVMFALILLRAPRYEAFVDRPFVVKLEVIDLEATAIARAEIRLPDGVYFDIEQFPELRQRRNLTLAWHNRDQKEFVPFVLNSTEEGTKTITVDFYDDNGRLVGTKRVDVRLKRAVQKG